MNLINLNLLSSTVTTNSAAETLWQLQNNEISTSQIWSGFESKKKKNRQNINIQLFLINIFHSNAAPGTLLARKWCNNKKIP